MGGLANVLRSVLASLWSSPQGTPAPAVVTRPADEQRRVDEQTSRLALYQFASCPFCSKVRSEIARLSLDIVLHDTKTDPLRRQELLSGGGKTMVPCLRITNDDGSVTWMYESADIVGYLQQRFAQAA